MLIRGALRSALLAVAGLGLLAPGASALSISAPVITNGTTTTATGGNAADRAVTQGAQVLSSGFLSFQTRFWTTGAADRGVAISGGSANATTTMNYTISFSVTHGNGAPYQIDIATSLLGALTAVDDAIGLGAGGSASIGAVTGTATGGIVSIGGLGLAGTSSIGGTGGTPTNLAVSRANVATIFGTGTGAAQNYSLTFKASFAASSPQNLANGDEEAYRFGLSTATGGPLGGASADDYAGQGGRNGLNDGHFVTLTVIPEPGTLLLLGAGVVGIAGYAKRRIP